MIALDLGPKILTARVICADNRGPKVLLCNDGEIVKFFRRGRLLTHHGYLPRAVQFKLNGETIRQVGLRTPEQIETIDGMAGEDTAVRYRPVKGKDLKHLIERGESAEQLCFELGKTMRMLHDHGVVFKANHIGNFIYEAGEPLGLIDFDNLYQVPFGLPRRVRKGNLRRLIRRDPELVNVEQLLNGYCLADKPSRSPFALPNVLRRQFLAAS